MTGDEWRTVLETAESVYDGWYAETRIDWEDFLDRVEAQSGVDLGTDMLAPHISKIKKHVRAYAREN